MPDSNHLYPLEDAIYYNSLNLVKFFINTNKIDYSVKIPIFNVNEEKEEEEELEEEEEEEFEEEEEEEFEEEEEDEKCEKEFKENDKKNAKFTTYLHIAIKSGNFKIIKEFLDNNLIDINITNSDGDTPLIEACKFVKSKIACRFESMDCIQTLFENEKLDFNHCNNDGYDAIAILDGKLKKKKIKRKKPIKDKKEYLMTIKNYLY